MKQSLHGRILAIDDESVWLENYKSWISESVAQQHSAQSTQEAVQYLKRNYYDVVLLDLSMSLQNPWGRGNRGIQDYLAAQPEGTRYIIISGVADRTEVREALTVKHAHAVIFKQEIDALDLDREVAAIIQDCSRENISKAAQEARIKLVGEYSALENKIYCTLHPKGGIGGLRSLFDNFFQRIAPIAEHRSCPVLSVYESIVFGHVWSRQRGSAVRLVFFNNKISSDEAFLKLDERFGYESTAHKIIDKVSRGVRTLCFAEPHFHDEDFTLPNIEV